MRMRMGMWMTAAVLAAVTVPASAMGGDDIDELLAKATEKFQERSYSNTGWTQRGSMAQGAEQTLTVSLQGGGAYQIIGMCDKQCSNLDATLSDPSGNVVASDTEADDFPIVAAKPQASGTYTLRVRMVTCGGDSCGFGVRLFRKNG